MSVSTMEALEALPVGTNIEVRGVRLFTWTRTARGWENDGALLTTDMFEPHVKAGQVVNQSEAGPVVGSWWVYGDAMFFVIDERPGESRLRVLQFAMSQPTQPFTEATPLRRHFNAAYVRATPEQIAVVCTPDRMGEVLMLFVRTREEREQRTQEVRTLKNRVDPTVMQPMVDAVVAGVAEAQRAIQQMNDALRNGQTEF